MIFGRLGRYAFLGRWNLFRSYSLTINRALFSPSMFLECKYSTNAVPPIPEQIQLDISQLREEINQGNCTIPVRKIISLCIENDEWDLLTEWANKCESSDGESFVQFFPNVVAYCIKEDRSGSKLDQISEIRKTISMRFDIDDITDFNLLISVYLKLNKIDQVGEILEYLGSQMNAKTQEIIFRHCLSNNNVEKAREWAELLGELNAYLTDSCYDILCQLELSQPNPESSSDNEIKLNYAIRNQDENRVDFFLTHFNHNQNPISESTLTEVAVFFATQESHERLERFIEDILYSDPHTHSIEFYTSLLQICQEIESLSLADRIFEAMKSKEVELDIESYRVMISLNIIHQNYRAAESLYDEIVVRGLKPDVALYQTMILVYGYCEKIPVAKKLYDHITDKYGVHCSVYVTLIMAHIAGEDIKTAKQLWADIDSLGLVPTVNDYFSFMLMLIENHLYLYLVDIYNEMRAKGLVPNGEMFEQLITAFNERGFFKGGEKLFDDMLEAKIVPSDDICTEVLAGMVSQGYSDEAINKHIEIMESFGYEVDDAMRQMIEIQKRSVNEMEKNPQLQTFNEVLKNAADQTADGTLPYSIMSTSSSSDVLDTIREIFSEKDEKVEDIEITNKKWGK